MMVVVMGYLDHSAAGAAAVTAVASLVCNIGAEQGGDEEEDDLSFHVSSSHSTHLNFGE